MTNTLHVNQTLPAFDSIQPEQVAATLSRLLDEQLDLLQSLLGQDVEHDWDSLFQPLEDQQDRLERVWSPLRHLHSVADNEALRQTYNDCLPRLIERATELGQNADLYRACKRVAESEQFAGLDTARKKVISNSLRDFRRSGVELASKDKDRYKALQQRLAQLQTRFEENLLDATDAWSREITDKSLLAGLPESALELAAETARQRGREGWLLTLEFPSYGPVMTYCDNRALRRELYLAYNTRASELSPHADKWDNGPLMPEILTIRQELAGLLGFSDYAAYMLETRMAGSTGEVMDFLNELAARSRSLAQQELAALRAFAAQDHGMHDLQAWDMAYYTEKLGKKRFDFSQEELRPWFPADQVVAGLFAVVNKLYGLRVTRRKGVAVWHPDVRFYDVKDAAGALRGSFYLDLYARPHKRGGAWMDECITRKRSNGDVQHPVAYLSCNFTPPVGDKPSLLTHDEVLTLFHEFGHGLHHILTLVDHTAVAGINGVPWDAVELPSQFLENWCWEREALALFARHYRTGEALPEAMFDKLRRVRTFHAGMSLARQLELALFDFRLHSEKRGRDVADIQALLNEVRRDVAVIDVPPENRFQHGFSHIFAGGYDAGYYSYKWAETLSADAFSRFEESGIFDAAAGADFLHCILEQGGSREPMDLFVEFRGRKPRLDALLRHSGITP